jgi:Rhs element Vgr protein
MSVVTPTILSEGKKIKGTYELVSIDVVREVNRIPWAELVFIDGDAAERKFEISDEAVFEPGKKIEVRLRYERAGNRDETVFKGLVVRHGARADGDGGAVLVVGVKDAAVKLHASRHSAVFLDKSDADIVGDLVGKAGAGVKKGKVEATKPKHKEIVQYAATDWDFIVSRAVAHGLAVVVDDGEVSMKKTELKGGAKHTFEWGMTEVYDFDMEADGSEQFDAVESVGWNMKDQKLTDASKAKAVRAAPGNLDAGKVAKALGRKTCNLSHPVPLKPDELKAWADARMKRSRMAMLRGRLAVPGLADLKLLDVISVQGISKRFNGKTLVTGVRHHVDRGGWRTDVRFGLSLDVPARSGDASQPPAAGLLPAVSGLQVGVVAPFKEDPDKEFRLKVILPGVDPKKDNAVWARLLTPEGGKKRGYFFRPEKDDEVIVGFLNDDPRHPVVLGSVFGSKNTPPDDFSKLDEDNFVKGIVTKEGTKLTFDDEKPLVSIETKAGNKVLLDDDGEAIEITDQHGNSVTMNKDGIEIKSAKDFKIAAKGDFKVDAKGNVEIKGAKVDVK